MTTRILLCAMTLWGAIASFSALAPHAVLASDSPLTGHGTRGDFRILPAPPALSSATILPALPATTVCSSAATLPSLLAPPPISPAASLLHGITVRLVREGRVVVATSRYEGDIPVAGAQVTVFAPGEDSSYLTGTTDPAGLFTFLPGTPGEWRVVVDDGMGHRREARMEVKAAPGTGAERDHPEVSRLGEHEEQIGHLNHEHDQADPEHGHADPGQDPAESPGQGDHAGAGEHNQDTHGSAQLHYLEKKDSDRLWRLATGLGLIFGLTGFAYGFTARRQRA